MPHDDSEQSFERFRTAFGEWLAGPTFRWTHFATLTFRQARGCGAMRHACSFLRDLAEDYGLESASAFVSMELGVRGSRHHIHGLLEFSGVSSGTLRDSWERRYGFARVSPYNPQRGGVAYVTKYVIKDACGSADWRLISTEDKEPDRDLFQASTRRAGYQLYSDWVLQSRKNGGG